MAKARVVRCPLCNVNMVYQDMDFWKCPDCNSEFWPAEEKSEEQKAKAIQQAYEEDIRVGFFGFGGKKGGSRSGKRYGKKKVPLITQRYALY